MTRKLLNAAGSTAAFLWFVSAVLSAWSAYAQGVQSARLHDEAMTAAITGTLCFCAWTIGTVIDEKF
jgi:hypothetical protein